MEGSEEETGAVEAEAGIIKAGTRTGEGTKAGEEEIVDIEAAEDREEAVGVVTDNRLINSLKQIIS